MDNKDTKGGNNSGTPQSETQNDLGVPIIQIFINAKNQLQWNWRNVSGEIVERILLDVFRGQVKYNLEKAQNKSKIIAPSLGETLIVNKGN